MLIVAVCALSATAIGVRAWLSRPLSALDRRLAVVDAQLDA